ncbi:hypothetical protein MBLNU13_g03338t1 [Cladosporium sp. NU13]
MVSGMLDVVTFVHYRVFASKQTGNVLFLAVYLFSHKNLRSKIEQNVVVSLLFFCIGSFVFGRCAHQSRPKKRGLLLSTSLMQTALVLVASLLSWVSTPKDITSASTLIVVALLAFAASGQTSMAVTVGLAELNTTMVTGAIIAMLNDPRLLHADNAARIRRLLYVSSYAAGCIIGAVVSLGPTGSLFVISAVKLIISASFLLNRGRAAARHPEAARSGEESYETGTPAPKAPSSPWRN